MKLSRRSSDPEPAVVDLEKSDAVAATGAQSATKGRPTPKRRVSEGRRGPVSAPRTRKEAYARQKQISREERQQRDAAKSTLKPRSVAEQRAALKRGDPSALPRRDQGATRKLARDYVDSHRMISNYLLWLFVVFVLVTYLFKDGSPIVLVLFFIMIAEWYYVGRKVRAMAIERFGKADGSAMSIGFYMGSRAYLPRRWRLPSPQVQRGDEI